MNTLLRFYDIQLESLIFGFGIGVCYLGDFLSWRLHYNQAPLTSWRVLRLYLQIWNLSRHFAEYKWHLGIGDLIFCSFFSVYVSCGEMKGRPHLTLEAIQHQDKSRICYVQCLSRKSWIRSGLWYWCNERDV